MYSIDTPAIKYNSKKGKKEYVPKIMGSRRGLHLDLPALENLISVKTYDIFGDIDIGQIYESSCFTIIQYNERGDIISGIFLCNYPNIPSIPKQEWLRCLKIHYSIEDVKENGTLFVHCLVWDDRYTENFFKYLLVALFDMDVHCFHVILVLPPQIEPVSSFLFLENSFADYMIRIVPINFEDTLMVQALYICTRYSIIPRLKIRRAVEEDNDDIIPIIDADSSYVKEFYGEYYISEMTRYPDGHRQLIVSEDDNGLATGVICVNSTIDVDLLNENFELTLYGGLRKSHETDEDFEMRKSASEILFTTFSENIFSDKSKHEQKSNAIVKENFEIKTTVKDDETRVNSLKTEGPIDVRTDIEGQTPSNEFEEIYRRKESALTEGKHVRITDVIYDEKSAIRFKEDISKNNNEIRSSLRKTSVQKEISHQESKEEDSDQNDGSLISNQFNISITFEDAIVQVPKIYPTISPLNFAESKSSYIKQDILVVPTYQGEVNAFVVEIFAVREDIGNRGTREFLEAAFECFPDLDYCVLLLPSCYSYFSFLELFVRIPLRYNKDFPMSLYVAHKAALYSEIKFHKGDLFDLTKVKEFLIDIPQIIFSHLMILSLVWLLSEKDHEEIKKHYHVEDFIVRQYIFHEAYGCLLHFVLMPIFSINQKYFFHEIMRLCDLTVLYYRLYEEEGSSLTRTKPIVSCLNTMVPVNSRRKIKYEFRTCVENDDTKQNKNKAFSLFMTTPRIATIPNRIIDTKIVVVGASDCGTALVEFLALGYLQNFVHFTNLTLISPNGLPYENHTDLKWDMIPFKGRYCRNYRYLITRRAWINVVYGTLLAINRKDKYVTVMDRGNLSYDFLILTCGLQYQKTLFRDKKMEKDKTAFNIFLLLLLITLNFLLYSDIIKSNQLIWNCLTINDNIEAFVSLKKIQSETNNFKEKKTIVFYGHNIDCYCAIHGLMKHGIEGSWITLIEPKLKQCDTENNFFQNCEVNTTIKNSILENEINLLLGWNVINWTLLEECQDSKRIESVIIRSGTDIKVIPCDFFFNFFEKEIDINCFLAICRAGLVFDGRLVINPQFRTNDPFVFAAGNITKYSRKFQAELFEHKYYNGVEIGEKLGKIIRKMVDVYQESRGRYINFDRSKSCLLLPEFRSPIIVSCILPGNFYYLHVINPGQKLSRDLIVKQSFYGDILVTGTCLSEIGYFRLRINIRNMVESVTCCSKKNFEVNDLISLYGKHDSMLNEVKYRFRNSLIVDFYAYFREPWAMALFYDRFECLRVENRATLLSKTNASGNSLVEDSLRALLKFDGEKISEKDRDSIRKKYIGSVYQQEIENSVVDFLQFSEEDLPVYCTPLHCFVKNEMLPSSRSTWKSAYYYNADNSYAFYRTTDINLEDANKSVKPARTLKFVPRSSSTRNYSPQRKPIPRTIRLTEYQEAVLEDQFKRWPRAPHTGDIVLLAAETGLSEDDVQDWYAIRLAQWRKEQGLGGNLGLH
ncbi:cilia- and flagella-associated protein 61-like isoform X2 [Vespula squamosa]|uniref:Cilia- and flagella-associated protein 61-like isoform X2 n=1 Tax=Vespula squamosa TaxID=30214 RepID=A0ABD2B1S1_VESSQ